MACFAVSLKTEAATSLELLEFDGICTCHVFLNDCSETFLYVVPQMETLEAE